MRGLSCEHCLELNESGERFYCAFMPCYGCRQLICFLCAVLFFPNLYPTHSFVLEMNETQRQRTHLCMNCTGLSRNGLLFV